MIALGTTFFTHPKSSTIPSHLHIIISDPSKCNYIVVVHVTSIHSQHEDKIDRTVFFHGGEHKNIYKPSFVYFKNALLLEVRKIQEALAAGIIHKSIPIATSLLQHIIAGAVKSQHTPNNIKEFIQKHSH